METNPVLKKLGLSANDRAVILHTDDIGMCQASVDAFKDLWAAGNISSGAVMMPCSWSLAAAEMAKANPAMDLGVHLTLTSEWNTYRWGPISTRDPKSGLIDPQGYFYRSSEEAQQYGDPAAAQIEIEAQVDRAIQAGIDPTHIDTHMGSVACAKYMGAYLQLAIQRRIPIMLFRMDQAAWQQAGLDEATAAQAAMMVRQLEENGIPLLDAMSMMNLEHPENRLEQTRQTLAALKPGVTHFIIHPSKDTPELRAITPDWACRVADYETFMSDGLGTALKDLGIHVIGYRDLKNLIH